MLLGSVLYHPWFPRRLKSPPSPCDTMRMMRNDSALAKHPGIRIPAAALIAGLIGRQALAAVEAGCLINFKNTCSRI